MARRTGRSAQYNHFRSRERLPGLGAFHRPELDGDAGDALSYFGEDFKREVIRKFFPQQEPDELIELGRHIPSATEYEPIVIQPAQSKLSRKQPNPAKFYDPEYMKLKVMERRLPASYSKQYRLFWTKKDTSIIKGEIRNELDRLHFPRTDVDVKFTNIVRVGDADKSGLGRKLALIPEAESPEAEFFCREHEICVNSLSRRLQGFRYPYDEYIPKLSFARVDRHQPEAVVKGIIGVAREMLPITVTMLPVEFYAEQNIRP